MSNFWWSLRWTRVARLV